MKKNLQPAFAKICSEMTASPGISVLLANKSESTKVNYEKKSFVTIDVSYKHFWTKVCSRMQDWDCRMFDRFFFKGLFGQHLYIWPVATRLEDSPPPEGPLVKNFIFMRLAFSQMFSLNLLLSHHQAHFHVFLGHIPCATKKYYLSISKKL